MADKSFDVAILGASGFTGQQAVRAMVRQIENAPLRWAVAGRNADKLRKVVAERVPAGKAQPEVITVDVTDLDAVASLAASTRVLLNLAGPYALTGETVVQACIANRAHYLDLSGETFWVRQLIARHHRAAERAGVRIIPCCGYEALPFDLATLWAARALRDRYGAPARELKIIVSFTGKRVTRAADAVSGGTVASLKMMLEHDRTDSMRNVACLMPEAEGPHARMAARRNAVRYVPKFDEDVQAVTGPTVPAPFVNPPIVLRSVALMNDATLFSSDFGYREATNMASLVPASSLLPGAATVPLQWAAAASLAAPLANLGAAVAGPLAFEREPLRKLVEWFAPRSGEGPSEATLDGMGYAFDVFACTAKDQRWRGRVEAQGHPGYRSTPEMVVAAALGLAGGTLGQTPHHGIVTPSTGLGIEAVDALGAAGVRYFEA
jgi:short subunit dehydrogenase-like uncharacterized protein